MAATTLYRQGFTHLISVTRPGCYIAPGSRLSDGSDGRKDDRGKSPGVMVNGMYRGYDWCSPEPPTWAQVVQWEADGSNIGIAAWTFPAFDIDVTDPDLADMILEIVERRLGKSVRRYGRRPKVLVMYRPKQTMSSFRVKFTRTEELIGEEETHLVEFLCAGTQYVIEGIHPATGQPYVLEDHCDVELLGPEAIPAVGEDDVLDCMAEIAEAMGKLGFTSSHVKGSRSGNDLPDQDSLKAPSIDRLVALLQETPNNLVTREEWIEFMYAVKASGADDLEAAYDAFAEWCERWQFGHNDPAQIEHEWHKVPLGNFRVGWSKLLQTARYEGVNTGAAEWGAAEAPPAGFQPGEVLEEQSEEVKASAAVIIPNEAPFSQDAIARRFVSAHEGRFLYVKEDKREYEWNGWRWVYAEGCISAAVRRYMVAVEVSRANDLFEKPKDKVAMCQRLGSLSELTAITTLVCMDPSIRVSALDLNKDAHLLGTPAGVVDLRDGRLLGAEEAKPKLVTFCTRARPRTAAGCPHWFNLLETGLQGDTELIEFIQRLAGYALTGDVGEHIFPYIYGPGRNGKSRFQEGLAYAMGDYAGTIDEALLQRSGSRNGAQSQDYKLYGLKDKRMVRASEIRPGHWDEQQLKRLTGGDEVHARPIFGSPVTFPPTFTLLVAGNAMPQLEDVGPAILDRMRVIPWEGVPAVKDTALPAKLEAEADAILQWAIDGAMEWYRRGLQAPEKVREFTKDYIDEADYIGQWMEACLESDPEGVASSKLLTDSFVEFMRSEGEEVKPHGFIRRVKRRLMRELGARPYRSNAFRGFTGIKILPIYASPGEEAPSNVVPFKGEKPC